MPSSLRRVEAVWSFVADKHGSAIVLPDGRCDIILRRNADDAGSVIPVITGPSTHAYRVQFAIGDQWHGVRLRPEHGAALWQRDLKSAVDTVLRGYDAKRFLPALAAFDDDTNSISELEKVIPNNSWPTVDQRVTQAIDVLHVSGGRVGIENLAQRVSCTARHLNRLFRKSIGLPPKTYAQLIQFHRTLRLIKTGNLSLSEAAYEGGYADQAHLTRAFRRFGNFSPSDLPQDLSLPTLFQS